MVNTSFPQFDMISRALLKEEDHQDLAVWTSALAFPDSQEGRSRFIELAAFSYYACEDKPSRRLEALWSLSSRGRDYHQVVKGRLEAYGQYKEALLNPVEEKISYQCFVDTQPFSERWLAKLAGLGWIGKNQNLIIDGIGSFVYIGIIYWQIPNHLVNDFLALSASQAMKKDQCGHCRLCVDACPGSALTEDGNYHKESCVSYLTQTKEPLTKQQIEIMGSHLYGCDICQRVCPYNQGVATTTIKEFAWTSDEASDEANQFLKLGNKELEKKHGYRSGRWRGWNLLRRNALINVYNKRRNKLSDEEWKELIGGISKESPMIRELIEKIEHEPIDRSRDGKNDEEGS